MSTHSQLSQELQNFVESLNEEDTTVGQLVERIGDRGFGLLLLILAFPAALPVPAPGYATPFGVLMIILGFQIIRGRTTPWLPERFQKLKLSYGMLNFALSKGAILFKAVELLIRPRLKGVAQNRNFLRLIGVIVVLMAASMSLPIPLTNTAPSFVIFMLAAGMLEEDGLFLIGGLLLAPVAAAIAFGALYYAFTYGVDAVEEHLKPLIKSMLGMEE